MNIGDVGQTPIVTFCIILLAALIIPEVLKSLRITSVPFFILAGIIIGPFGIGLHLGEGLIFLGEIGLLFLVFLAGMEIFESGGVSKNRPYLFTLIAGSICFAAGFLFGRLLGHGLSACLLLGSILVSSSVAEIIPMVNATPSVKERYGNVIIPGIIILDAGSLFMMSTIVQLDSPRHEFLVFILEASLLVIFSLFVLPKLIEMYFNRKSRKPREGDLKFILAILMGVVAIAYLIGLHGIVAAFLVGLVMGEFITSKRTFDKISGIGHGMLIPVFFIVLGMQLEINLLWSSTGSLVIIVGLIFTLTMSKLFGGIIYASVKGNSTRDGLLMGLVLFPQLSATIAATKIGYEKGIFDQDILISVVFMAVITTLFTPLLLRYFTRNDRTRVDLTNHTVVAGYGRTTSKISYMLHKMNVPLVVVDGNPAKLKKIAERGYRTVYGNIASSDTQDVANIKDANLVLLAVDSEHDLYIAARDIRAKNPDCHVIAKIHTERMLMKLKKENLIDEYIWPEKRSSHEVADKVYSKIIQYEREVLDDD